MCSSVKYFFPNFVHFYLNLLVSRVPYCNNDTKKHFRQFYYYNKLHYFYITLFFLNIDKKINCSSVESLFVNINNSCLNLLVSRVPYLDIDIKLLVSIITIKLLICVLPCFFLQFACLYSPLHTLV